MNFTNSIAKHSNFAFANFWWKFFRISRQIPENSDVTLCRFFNQICENKSEICRKFCNLWKKFTIIVNYSLHSLNRSRPRRAAGFDRSISTFFPPRQGLSRLGTFRTTRSAGRYPKLKALHFELADDDAGSRCGGAEARQASSFHLQVLFVS